MEMRDDIRGLRPVVDAVSCDQALSVERRAGGRHTITAHSEPGPPGGIRTPDLLIRSQSL